MALQPKTTKQTKILGYTPDVPFTSAAWGSLRPGPAEVPGDKSAGDNTTKLTNEQAVIDQQNAVKFGDVTDVGSDADTLGRSSGGIKRRAAARALLG